MPASDFYFSNGYYHFINKYKNETTIYNKNFKRIKEPIWNTHSKDFESDSISYIASIDTKGKINWKIDLGLNPSELNVSLIDNFSKNKLILSYFSSNTTKIKILDAKSGAIEKVKKLEKRQSVNLVDSTIYIMKNRQITTMNLDLEILDSVTTDFRNKLLAATFFDHNHLVLIIEGSSIVQSLSAFESNLDKVANIDAQGVIYYLSNSKYISLFNSATKKSTLLSFHAVNWYNKITAETLRTLVISFLIIITFVMVLWISTLRVSSKKIKQQKDELEESHAELKETTDKLIEVEKLAVYGTIAGSIAHEINSPLGAIINSAQRIKEDKNADIQKNIALIEKAGKRSKSIIEKLLVGTPNSHIDSNSDLVEVINDWKALSAQQFDNLGITIQTQIDCNSKLAISSTELNQILTNLLFNARDSIMESNNPVKTIVIESHQEHKKCLISIYDTGTGFSKSKLENPFEAFKTSKKRGQGTGLGLWVIKRIIDEVGGEIKILNCDVGAKVEITIPEYIDKENDKN
jgi:C4-dicarboxylate-specific signal transduction histidine kinase